MSRTFVFLAGHPALDFLNTILIHPESIEDSISTAHDISLWMNEAEEKHSCILNRVKKIPTRSHLSGKAIETVKFRNLARQVLTEDIEQKNSFIHLRKLVNKYLKATSMELQVDENMSLKMMSHVDVRSNEDADRYFCDVMLTQFIELLSIADFNRVKICKNPRCSHFFLDRTKAKNREWCSGKSCGNIVKVRAHRERKKAMSS